MLSQRIALFSNRLLRVSGEKSGTEKDYLNELETAISLFKYQHEALLLGKDKLKLPALYSEALKKIYFHFPYRLDYHVKLFIQLAESVLQRIKKGESAEHMDALVQITDMAKDELLQGLDVAVWQFQTEADTQNNVRRKMVYAILIFMILTLLLGFYDYRLIRQMERKNRDLMISEFVFNHASDGIITTDGEGTILTANAPVRDLIGYASGALRGRKIDSLIVEIALHSSILGEIQDVTAKTGEWRGEIIQRMENKKPLSVGLRAVYDNSESKKTTITNYVVSLTDISKQKVSEDKFRFLSLHDKLTGLLNRAALAQEFQSKAAIAEREKTDVYVLMMDLDGFKQANDTFGHDAGDHILVALSERIVGVLRASDTVARLGGDEFLVLASQSSDSESNPEKVAEKILQAIAEPVQWHDDKIAIGISIGIAKYPDDGEDLETLLKKADTEMYRVKESGKNSFSMYVRRPTDC